MVLRGVGLERMYLVPSQLPDTPAAPLYVLGCPSFLDTTFPHPPELHILTCDPVYGDALHAANAIGHYILAPCLVSLSTADGA